MLMVTAIEPLIGGLKCKKLFFKNLRIIEPLIGGLIHMHVNDDTSFHRYTHLLNPL